MQVKNLWVLPPDRSHSASSDMITIPSFMHISKLFRKLLHMHLGGIAT